MKSVISEKGQITIPKRIRDKFGLHPGTEIEFSAEEETIVLTKILSHDPLTNWRGRGKLQGFKSVDDYIKAIR